MLKQPRSQLTFAFAVALTGCATAPVAAPVPRPTFSYGLTAGCKPPGSSKVTFAIVAPQWAKGTAMASIGDAEQAGQPRYDNSVDQSHQMYSDFSSAMQSDFVSLMACKGFATKGPFASYEEMVFPDRSGSDLVLVPQVDIQVRIEPDKPVAKSSWADLGGALLGQKKEQTYSVSGAATISGRVTLAVMESVTNTRMWSKPISIEPHIVPFVGEGAYSAEQLVSPYVESIALRNDPGLLRALGPKLQTVYREVLNATSQYVNVDEMQLVKKQSAEVRAKSGILIPHD